jgi:hypothetical protein
LPSRARKRGRRDSPATRRSRESLLSRVTTREAIRSPLRLTRAMGRRPVRAPLRHP